MAKILIVEDEQPLREEILDWLTFEGYEVLGAADGIEGVELARQHLPDLIICDIMMPYLDGYGVLLELRSRPATLNIPLIFLTAKSAREDVRQGMRLGADDYLPKPFERTELLESIQMRLDKRRLQNQEFEQQLESLYQTLDHENERRYLETRLVSTFSHDVRNVLAMIISSNSLLRDYADRMSAERRLAHLDQVESSAQHMLKMLDDLTVVVQLETRFLKLTPALVELIPLVEGIIEEYRKNTGKTHRIVFHAQCPSSVRVSLDQRLVRQILINLLSNAVKYSSQDSEIQIIGDYSDGQVSLVVSDHGIGIPDEDRPLVFNALQRASNVSHVKGAGIGLTIVKQAVDLHGGQIAVESKVNVGTTITVTLPEKQAEKENTINATYTHDRR